MNLFNHFLQFHSADAGPRYFCRPHSRATPDRIRELTQKLLDQRVYFPVFGPTFASGDISQ